MTAQHHNHRIYLDYHATTPVDPRVAQLVYHYMTTVFGNASSTDHVFGDEAGEAVAEAKQQIARLINCSPKEVIFTSGATESINLAIQGLLLKSSKTMKLAVLPVEHKAVLDTCASMAKKGLTEVIFLKVDNRACLDLEELERVCRQGIDLLCLMAANNEVGTIYPLPEVGEIVQRYGVRWLCDASQAVGKIHLDFDRWGISFLAISGHKFYAPKGVGALVIRRGQFLEPILYGGGHQRGLRSGTLNVPGIAGLGEACRLRLLEMTEDETRVEQQRNRLQYLLQTGIENLVVNGDVNHRLAGNLHVSIPGIPNSAIIARVRHRIAISTGSACSSGVEAPSHVLRAMQLPDVVIDGALRIGLGKFTTDDEVEQAAQIIINTVLEIQNYFT
ncbi:MAG: cysteine desulfurase family protein [Acidobacteriota bacterium]|nr:cysteine desulfurase family protein [Acidobacteriota bacterium]